MFGNKAVVQLIIKGKNATGSAVGGAVRGLRRLSRTVFDVGKQFAKLTALAGAAGTALTLTFIKAADTSEGFRVRLNALLGDVEKGNQLFKDMAKFAGQVSFTYEQIMGSATALAGVVKGGVGEINALMPIIADLAAVSGLSIEDTTSQIIRMYSAGAAAADMFRERGILAMLGFQAGVSVSAEETMRRVVGAWEDENSKFRGAANELAKTWSGLISMMSDRWFVFRNMVADAGLFDAAKVAVGRIIEALDEMSESGRLQEIARNVSDTILNIITSITRLVFTAKLRIEEVAIRMSAFFGMLPAVFYNAKAAILGALAGILRALGDFVLNVGGALGSLPGPLGDIFGGDVVGGAAGALMAGADWIQAAADRASYAAKTIFTSFTTAMMEELDIAREKAEQAIGFVTDVVAEGRARAAAKADPLAGLTPQLAGGGTGIGLRGLGDLPGAFGVREEARAMERAAEAHKEAMERAKELDRVTSDLVSGSVKDLADGFAEAFEQAASGAISLGDALKKSMLGALASISKSMAQFFFAQALAALGMGVFLGPFGAAKGIAAAAKLTAAGLALSALSGALSGIAGGGGGGEAPSTSDAVESAGRGRTTIIFDGSFINLADPDQRKQMVDLINEVGATSDSEVIVQGG